MEAFYDWFAEFAASRHGMAVTLALGLLTAALAILSKLRSASPPSEWFDRDLLVGRKDISVAEDREIVEFREDKRNQDGSLEQVVYSLRDRVHEGYRDDFIRYPKVVLRHAQTMAETMIVTSRALNAALVILGLAVAYLFYSNGLFNFERAVTLVSFFLLPLALHLFVRFAIRRRFGASIEAAQAYLKILKERNIDLRMEFVRNDTSDNRTHSEFRSAKADTIEVSA